MATIDPLVLRDSKPAEKGRKYSCVWCKNSFSSQKNLQRHLRKVQYCKLKRLEIQSKKGKKKDSGAKKRKKRVFCDECGNSYSSQKALKVHVDSVHLGKTYPCHVCQKNFSQHSNLVNHQKTHAHLLEVFKETNDL